MSRYLGIFIDQDSNEELTVADLDFIPNKGDKFLIELAGITVSCTIDSINFLIGPPKSVNENRICNSFRLYVDTNSK